MCRLIYDEDAYLTSFEANVTRCEAKEYQKKPAFDIVLDATAFFPEQGGQDCDSGSLFAEGDEVHVLHVSIKDGVVHHICDRPIEPGTAVTGCISWEQRFDRMQQHSGEHLVSGTVHRLFGADNVGFHLSARETTLDFNREFTADEIAVIEDTVNRAIFENIETHIFFPSPDELNALQYRSKKELTGRVRIVEFPGYDVCACCAPHVKRTGEIGSIRILSAEHFKTGTRMTIVCGSRAILQARSMLAGARRISQITSSKLEDIAPAVDKLSESLKQARFELVRLERENISEKALQAAGSSHPILFINSGDGDLMRFAATSLSDKCTGYCGVFSGDDETGFRFIIASKDSDCRAFLNEVKASYTVRGGGSSDMVQGSIEARHEDITGFWNDRTVSG